MSFKKKPLSSSYFIVSAGLKKVLFIIILSMFWNVSAFQRVNIVGDSISAGINPQESGSYGWVQMLYGKVGTYESIDSIFPGIEKYNHAISGSKASDWAVPSYTGMANLVDSQPDLVFVLIGGNDFLAYIADGEFSQTEQNQLYDDIKDILLILKNLPSEPAIILINYYDLFDGVSHNLPSAFQPFRVFSEEVITGNQILEDAASEQGVYYIDTIYSRFMGHCYGREFGADESYEPPYVALPAIPNFDIHPVTAGHEALYEEVFHFLEETFIQKTFATYWHLLP